MFRSLLTAASTTLALSLGLAAAAQAQDAAAPTAPAASPQATPPVATPAASPEPVAQAPVTQAPASAPTSQEVAALAPGTGGLTAPAAYLSGPSRVSEADMLAFLANPPALLSAYPQGGAALANQVRLLAASNNRAVPQLLSLASQDATSAVQRAAIGAGLARAAQAGQGVAPTYAAFIQEAVAASNNPAVISAYTAALAQPATAALGAAGGGGGAGGGAAGGAAGGGAGSLSGGGTGGTNRAATDSPSAFANGEAVPGVSRGGTSLSVTDGNGAAGTSNFFVTNSVTNNFITTNTTTLPSVTESRDASPAR
ncbi:hypothetical protein [Aureimonas sp. N4]|uniref:hypothetical protein n=1 Tax=Aureimonas sp. N4 TaxID=1638165 RepID=UPI0007803917|nr:hypothetical protein [Aureimonas sp. N4]